MMMITMIMMIILISQWNCSDIRDLINQERSCILSKGGGGGGGRGGSGSNPQCLPDCHVGIHSKSDTHFFRMCSVWGGRDMPTPYTALTSQVARRTEYTFKQNLVPNCSWWRKYFDKKGNFQRWFLRKNFDRLHIFVQKEWIFEINLGFG